MRASLRLLACLTAVLLVAACEPANDVVVEEPRPTPQPGDPEELVEPPDAGPPEQAVAPPNGAVEVEIRDFAFEPPELEVVVGAGVQWINRDGVAHTVTFDDDESSGSLPASAEWMRVFDEPGAYDYVCDIHPNMTGTVTVGE